MRKHGEIQEEEMDNDLISRSALLEVANQTFDTFIHDAHFKAACDAIRAKGAVIQMIKDTHTVDAEVVRHGRWTRLGPNWHECSVCKARTSIFPAQSATAPTAAQRWMQRW